MSERDICTKFITPALKRAGWDELAQIREEVSFTKGRIIVRGKLVTRGKAKRADYILYYKNNSPIALIEAKDNNHSVGDGMQQGLEYAETLEIPFVFSSNGDGFIFHDRSGGSAEKEGGLGLDAFPSPTNLWVRYAAWKGLTSEAEQLVLQDYFDDGSGKAPRYYQVNAVNAAIEVGYKSPKAARASAKSVILHLCPLPTQTMPLTRPALCRRCRYGAGTHCWRRSMDSLQGRLAEEDRLISYYV